MTLAKSDQILNSPEKTMKDLADPQTTHAVLRLTRYGPPETGVRLSKARTGFLSITAATGQRSILARATFGKRC